MLHHSSPLLFPRTCGTYGMVYHAIGHQVLFTQTIPWEPIDFTRGDKGSKHVPLPTYIFFCSQKVLVGRFYLYVLDSVVNHYINLSLVLNLHLNSFICCPWLVISTRPCNLLSTRPCNAFDTFNAFHSY